jgi:hypothetical protein
MLAVVMSGWSKLTPGAAPAEVIPAYINARTARRDRDSRRQTRQDDVCLPIVEAAIKEGTLNLLHLPCEV